MVIGFTFCLGGRDTLGLQLYTSGLFLRKTASVGVGQPPGCRYFFAVRGNMAMPEFKATLFFQNPTNSTGWTENWYLNSGSYLSAEASVVAYIAARVACLLDTTSITAVRIANVDPPRDSQLFTLVAGNQGTIVSATYPSAGVWDCLLVSLQNASFNLFGHLFMHDVPAGIFVGRTYVPNSVPAIGWVAKKTALDAAIVAAAFQRKKKGPTYEVITSSPGLRRTEHRLGRPFDTLRGRRSVA